MPIITLQQIKEVEAMIATMSSKSMAAITKRINEVEEAIGSYIANQLRQKLWAQARALELI